MSFLCIAIPTFNRREHLKRRLEELVPQLTEEVSLCVFDNGSDDGTPDVVAPFAGKVFYQRSDFNLGMCRNFMRCFEETSGDWLWILGDDEPIQADAVSRALTLIRSCGDGIINFTTSCGENSESTIVSTLEEFFAKKDVTSVMYVSANLYERSSIRNSLRILAPTSFTVAPNVAVIVHALQSARCRLHLSSEQLLSPEANPRRWSALEVSLGLSVFPEIIQSQPLQKIAALGLRANTRWMLLWGLVEIATPEELLRWRRICRQTNSNLSCYGATLFSAIVYNCRSKRSELRREILLSLIMNLPIQFTRLAASAMKRRIQGASKEVCRELE